MARRSQFRLGIAWILSTSLLVSPRVVEAQLDQTSLAQADPTPSIQLLPSRVRIGDTFRLEVRVSLPEGWILEAPDSILGLRGVRQIGPGFSRAPGLSVSSAVVPEGTEWVASYPLLALRTGYRPLPSLGLRKRDPASIRGSTRGELLLIPPGGISVESVLPPPGEVTSPAPILSAPGSGKGLLFLGFSAAAMALLTGIGWIWTERKGRGSHPETALEHPRQYSSTEGEVRATNSESPAIDAEVPRTDGEASGTEGTDLLRAQLRQLLSEGPSGRQDSVEIVEEATHLLRKLLEARTSSRLAGFTTPEVLLLLRNGLGGPEKGRLKRALLLGDHLRFQRDLATPEEIAGFRDDISRWIEADGDKDPAEGEGGQDV